MRLQESKRGCPAEGDSADAVTPRGTRRPKGLPQGHRSLLQGLCFSLISLAFLVTSVHASRTPVVRLILVASQSEAENLLSEIRSGKSFPVLAKERSLDEKSREKYGELDGDAVAGLGQPLREIISQMGEGEISGVIALGDKGFALVQMVDLNYYRKGARAFRAKDFRTAEMNLLRHVEANPDAVRARVMLGQIYESRKAFGKAEENYRDALRLDPKQEEAYLLLGALYLKGQRFPQAKSLYEESLTHIPDSEPLKTGIARANERISLREAGTGGSGSPGSETRQTVPLRSETPKDPVPVDTPKSKISEEVAPGDRAEGKPSVEPEVTKRAVPKARQPEGLPSGNSLTEKTVHLRIIVTVSESDAEAVLSEMNNGKSFASLAKERSIDENSRDSYGYLGEVEVSSLHARVQEALSDLKEGQTSGVLAVEESRYVLVQSTNISLYREGEKAFIAGDFAKAEEKLRLYVELNPDAVKARTMLGRIYEDKKEFGEAIAMYKNAISFSPRTVLVYERLARIYLNLGQYQRAKEVYAEGLRQVPSSPEFEEGIEMADILLIGKGARMP